MIAKPFVYVDGHAVLICMLHVACCLSICYGSNRQFQRILIIVQMTDRPSFEQYQINEPDWLRRWKQWIDEKQKINQQHLETQRQISKMTPDQLAQQQHVREQEAGRKKNE